MTSKTSNTNLRRSQRIAAVKASVNREYFVRKYSRRLLNKLYLSPSEGDRLQDIGREHPNSKLWRKSPMRKTFQRNLRSAIDYLARILERPSSTPKEQIDANVAYYNVMMNTRAGNTSLAVSPFIRHAHAKRIDVWCYVAPYNSTLQALKENYNNCLASLSTNALYVPDTV
jgi:AAA15 family ATPase/GTPase